MTQGTLPVAQPLALYDALFGRKDNGIGTAQGATTLEARDSAAEAPSFFAPPGSASAARRFMRRTNSRSASRSARFTASMCWRRTRRAW